MKLLNFLLLFMLGGAFSLLFATDEILQQQIQKIQDAPKEKRMDLMNKLKIEMSKMNFYERNHVMDMLRKNRDAQVNKNVQTQQMVETRKQEQAQEIQAQTYAHLTQYQSYLRAVSQEVQTRLIDPVVTPLPLNK